MTKHTLSITDLGMRPTASCSCGQWNAKYTALYGETDAAKKKRLRRMFKQHADRALVNEMLERTTPARKL